MEKRMRIDQTPLPVKMFEPVLLRNGWLAPPPADLDIPKYVFHITRTRNKPKDAIGFLPMYTKYQNVVY